ncbi:hypothetical protein TWF569_009521 [Orbilia oligospora]|uniref:Autophagy-related protein n=1 Tax=Orbilia oligospora TaxID=2813651 RepID=A0A7C8J4G9_ORBOL|nr:hypothetical protein TWF102_009835 [Orbilia oligospora]KAF3104532.1 hypothetical protein TWF103_006857 [Orbilia oligospora]KAF3126358.1 hypothetical protein TWF594_001167 [Orbilia oligospora]KAF3136212.1 hypothetical protein TWF569_009521 [Orbilia oligospora]
MSRAVDLLASKLPKPSTSKPLAQRLRERLPFASHIPLHASLTYLFAICLFSISFLVFLNSALSFVVTDLFGIQDGVGSIVGTLGFVDELVAVFMVIFWGVLSDRIGTRTIAVSGYILVGVSLVVVVQVKSVYPGLVLARILFSMGASATVVSVTAVLPEISAPLPDSPSSRSTNEPRLTHTRHSSYPNFPVASDPSSSSASNRDRASSAHRPAQAGSSSSTSTASTLVTSGARPAKWRPPSRSRSRQQQKEQAKLAPKPITGKLSGVVGFMTGCGALVALIFFLPLPTKLAEDKHMTRESALKHTFYIVACVSWTVALTVFIGLRGGGVGGTHGEFWKIGNLLRLWRNWRASRNDASSSGGDEEASEDARGANDERSHERSSLLPDTRSIQSGGSSRSRTGGYDSIWNSGIPGDSDNWKGSTRTYFQGLWLALKAGKEDWRIGLGYLGGFVARSMSVGISLFIPLYVNQWMRARGMCPPVLPSDPNYKKSCREAYILAAMLTGTSQLSALVFAPIVGYFSDRYEPQYPLLATAVLGFFSCAAFSALQSLSVGADRSWAYLHCAMMGIGQIGAIVSSLALIGNAIQDPSHSPSLQQIEANAATPPVIDESTSLNPTATPARNGTKPHRLAFKGSISGVYSLCGAAGILLLTQFGGWGADHVNSGFAFDLLAVFFTIEIALGCWLIFRSKATNV